MKLRKLLKMLDPLADIVVWTRELEELNEEEPAFEGIALDCPYWLAECILYKGLDDGDHMISVRKTERDNAALIVSVEEVSKNE